MSDKITRQQQKINALKAQIAKIEADEKKRLRAEKRKEKEKQAAAAAVLGFEVLKYDDENVNSKLKIVGLLEFFKTTTTENKNQILKFGREELAKRKEQKKAVSR